MLQKEFEDRIGRQVSEQEYLEANAMYENAGDMDKDEFCLEWLKIGSSRLVRCLSERVYQLGNALRDEKALSEAVGGFVSDAADRMLEVEKELLGGASVERVVELLELLNDKAGYLVGRREIVLRKIKVDVPLNEEDRNYIREHLK